MHRPLLVSFSQKLVACESKSADHCYILFAIWYHMALRRSMAHLMTNIRYCTNGSRWSLAVHIRPQPGEIQAMEQIVRDVMAMEQREVPLGGWTRLNHSGYCPFQVLETWDFGDETLPLFDVQLCLLILHWSMYGFVFIRFWLQWFDKSRCFWHCFGQEMNVEEWLHKARNNKDRWKQFDPCIRQS